MQRSVLLVLLALPFFASAQFGAYHLEKAEELAWGNLYSEAIPVYKKAYTKVRDNDKPEILYKIGECYRNRWEADNAANWYSKSIKAGYNNPAVWYKLGQAHKQQQHYDKARAAFNQYLELQPNDERGKQALESCNAAENWMANPARVVVELMHAANSSAHDFRPFPGGKNGETLWFTSDREGSTGSRTHGWTGNAWPDVYSIKRTRTGGWSKASPVAGDVNTEVGEGSAVLSNNGKTMLLTRCNFKPHGIAGCEIYVSKRQGKNWSAGELIPIDLDTFNVGHPCFAPDENTLLFSANIDGGFGGRDLWRVTKTDEGWSEPVNLGPSINTADSEIYPYIASNGTLYFSSDGHTGMGGMDIFRAKATEPYQWGAPENLQAPINSPRDDFGFVLQGDEARGLFSSNREGGKGGDDIYTFYTPRLVIELFGAVVDMETEQPITGATVSVTGTDGLALTLTTSATGNIEVSNASSSDVDAHYLQPGFDYTIRVSHPDYFAAEASESTVGVEESVRFEHNFMLMPAVVEDGKEYSMPMVLYDYAKASLRPEASDSLDYLLTLLNENPNIAIQIEAHTDTRGSSGYNNGLSHKRAKACVDYLIAQGIDAGRLTSKGFGESRPLFTDAYVAGLATVEEREAAHQRNRRTVFSVLSTTWNVK